MNKVSLPEIVKITNALTENNISYWLAGGILLGLYRDKQIITYDNNVDLGVYDYMYEESNKIKLINLMYKLNYKLWYVNHSKIVVINSFKQFHVEFFRFRKNDKYYYHPDYQGYFYYPLECLDKLQKYSYNEKIKFFIPNNPEKYLICQYGNWKIPNSNFKKPNDYKNYTINLKDLI